jgi:hypothetical protein
MMTVRLSSAPWPLHMLILITSNGIAATTTTPPPTTQTPSRPRSKSWRASRRLSLLTMERMLRVSVIFLCDLIKSIIYNILTYQYIELLTYHLTPWAPSCRPAAPSLTYMSATCCASWGQRLHCGRWRSWRGWRSWTPMNQRLRRLVNRSKGPKSRSHWRRSPPLLTYRGQ